MPAIEFIGQSSQDPDNRPAAPSRLVNCYREPVGGRTQYVVKSVLGMTAFASLDGAFCRAMARVQGRAYVAHGDALWRLSDAGEATSLGAIPNAETTIAGNNGAVTVCAGGRYFVWDGTALTEPVPGAFDDFGSVTFFAQRTVLSERGGRRIQWSELADPADLDALSFATAEQRDDAILRLLPVGGELWIFKEGSIERWYDDGAGLSYIPGTAREPGLRGFGLLTPIRNGAFFVGSDGKAYIAGGGDMKPISTIPVETSIEAQNPQTCFFYSDEGHDICVITFRGRPAWCYDLSTGEWHERGEDGGWTARACVEAHGGWLVGDDSGGIWRLARTNTDKGGPLRRVMVSRTLQIEGRRFRVPRLQFQARVGRTAISGDLDELPDVLQVAGNTVLAAGDGALLVAEAAGKPVPKVMLRVSGDHGQTWGITREASLGDLGQYDTQIVFRALGQFRSFTVELSCAEPIDAPIDATGFVDVA